MRTVLIWLLMIVSSPLAICAQDEKPFVPNKRNLERLEIERMNGSAPASEPLISSSDENQPENLEKAPRQEDVLPSPSVPQGAAPDVPRNKDDAIERPTNSFVVDQADIITQNDEHRINEDVAKLLEESRIPLYVVTVKSMFDLPGHPTNIEKAAQDLYDRWGIGFREVDGQPFNKGILLLVARDDRKLRIELGAGYGTSKDYESKQIVDQILVPHFRQGEYSSGITAASRALCQMARGQEISAPTTSQSIPGMLVWGPIVLIIAGVSIYSLMNSGRSGWAWIFWGGLFSLLGLLIYHLLSNSGRSSRGGFGGGGFGGGSFGGGGFGGGFSGGGGASGSW